MTAKENNERREDLVNQCKSFIDGIYNELINFIQEKHPDYKKVPCTYRTELFNKKNNTWFVADIPEGHIPKTLSIWVYDIGIKNKSIVWNFNKTEISDLYENKLKNLL